MESIEILAVVESVSNEKGIEEEIIFSALEIAIASASLRHFHEDADISVSIDKSTGEYTTHRHWLVENEDSEDFHKETHISEADSEMSTGDTFSKDVDNVVFGRIETRPIVWSGWLMPIVLLEVSTDVPRAVQAS